jgi:hypothetical protein
MEHKNEKIAFLYHSFERVYRFLNNQVRPHGELRPGEAGVLWCLKHAKEGKLYPSQ